MSSLSKLTAASAPLIIGKTTYKASPLSDKAIAELDEWVQHRYVQNARDSLPKTATQAERQETIGIALDRSVHLTWMSGLGAKMIASVDGWIQITWQMLRREHPDLSLEDLRAKMFSKENIEASADNIEFARLAFEKLNVFGESKKGAKKKTGTKVTKKKKKKKPKKRNKRKK